MRNVARVTLAIVVFLAAIVFLPRPASRVVMPPARAQLVPSTPSVPDVLDDSKDKVEDTTGGGGGGTGDITGDGGGDGGGGGGGDGGGGGGDGTGTGGGTVDKATDTVGGTKPRPDQERGTKGKRRRRGREFTQELAPFRGSYRIAGSFDTDKLVAKAAHLRSLGVPRRVVIRKVFPPFIIGGPAGWSDTWGAVRYGPGPIVRRHEGQDVFCQYGDPVLASEDGRIEFDEAGLGGRVARLYRDDGSYWYYAHLSGWNTQDFSSGDAVKRGDVIGYCGNSGNAITTPPHVHFGWYQANGGAKNPMKALVDWLRAAERRAFGVVSKATNKRVRNIDQLTVARRFGDAFLPDRSELTVPGESLWASGSSPASGAFGLAEAALQAALSGTPIDGRVAAEPTSRRRGANGFQGLLDGNSVLGQLLDGSSSSAQAEVSD